ncbi:protein PERCC1 [Rhea pennata]|uniref:protein PERCC1 n=1 Tax=Rhea pennata TaxID=8795 RepID=UPI002E2563B5
MHGPSSAALRVSPGPGGPPHATMAAGIIRHLAELRLPSPFPHALLLPAHPEPDFPDLSEEEEDEEEEDEEEEDEAAAEGAGGGQELASPSDAETTLQLLKFSELISCDIQRYFGRRGRDEDAEGWGAAEDCRSLRRSGRELCSGDLLRAARSGEPREEEAAPAGPRGRRAAGGAPQLGPLAELFEYGLRRCLQPPAADGKKQRLERKYAHITPMHKRKLPQSFWREPGPGPALHPSTPDFSDLLANWTAEPAPELPGAGRELPPEPGRPGPEAERSGAA